MEETLGRTCPSKRAAVEPLERRALLSAAAAPIVITHGGTYTGEFTSTDPNTPVITINTTEPVIIDHATLTGPGDLVEAAIPHTNITIRNTTGIGVNPNVAGESKGRFLDADQFDNAVIENNILDGTAGIFLLDYQGNRTGNNIVRVIGNRAHNIDGRKSDGHGGYLDFNVRFSKADGHEEDGFTEVQFLQLNKVVSVPNIEIAWNEVINDPGNSRVEDNISIYKSSGTQASPILIHDNYIQGAYTIKPAQKSHVDDQWTWDWSYSGGGILLSDGLGDNGAAGDPAYVQAYDNQVVSTTNYGIAISTGHDIQFHDNRIVSSGKLADGEFIAAQNVGAYIWDADNVGSARFFNNSARNNTLGWNVGETRNDWWIPDSTHDLGNNHWSGSVTNKTEAAEHQLWLTRMYAQYPDRKPTLSLAGTIYNDTNGNGAKDVSEGGATGFRVFLDKDGDGRWDKNELYVRSSSTGRYTFYNLPRGTYTVRITPVAGWRATGAPSARITLKSTGTTTRYFSVTRNALVTGTVFMDANKNGSQNSLEPGLAGWRVFADLDGDGLFDPNEASVLSDKNGKYALSVAAGAYDIRTIPQSGYRATTSTGIHLNLAAGATDTANNFGQKRLKA